MTIKLHPVENPPKKNGMYVVWFARDKFPTAQTIEFYNGKWNVSANDDSTEMVLTGREYKVYWSEVPQIGEDDAETDI